MAVDAVECESCLFLYGLRTGGGDGAAGSGKVLLSSSLARALPLTSLFTAAILEGSTTWSAC